MCNIHHSKDNVPCNCGITLRIMKALDSLSFALIRVDSLNEPTIYHRSAQNISVWGCLKCDCKSYNVNQKTTLCLYQILISIFTIFSTCTCFVKKMHFVGLHCMIFFTMRCAKNIKFVTVNIGGPQTYKNDLMWPSDCLFFNYFYTIFYVFLLYSFFGVIAPTLGNDVTSPTMPVQDSLTLI